MNEEKILYFSENRNYEVDYLELRRDDAQFNLLYDMVHNKKYLNWSQDEGYNTYRITNLGRVRLYLYRLKYAEKNKSESYEKRLLELKETVKMYPKEAEFLRSGLGKDNRKLLNKAFE